MMDIPTRSIYYCNYSIGADVYKEVSQVCKVYGKRILLIGGKTALEIGAPRLRARAWNRLDFLP